MPGFLDLHGRTSKAVRAVADARLRRHGLHLGQDHLLALLWAQDGRTPGELAAALEVSTPTVVKAATRMSAAGLLERRPDERDRRLVRIWLTDAGRALQAPIEQERQQLEEEITADLSAAERDQLLNALAKVQKAAALLLEADSTN
jgi:DNA-binding MarR family transcriptional regulator